MSCSAVMSSARARRFLLVTLSAIIVACDAESSVPGGRGSAVGGQSGSGGTVGSDASFGNPPRDASLHPLLTCDGGCAPAPDTSVPDDDGFSVAEGDCDDFSALVNPGAYDVPGNGIDEDCEGGDALAACDAAIDLASADAFDAARAIDLCARTEESSRRWGVISARWTAPDGMGAPLNPLAYGILPSFGPAFAPRGGDRMLAISSGVARAADQPGFTQDCSDIMPASSANLPAGFDGSSPSCPEGTSVTTVTDGVALELRIRIPSNANALTFDSAFFTNEYPVYICSSFNDFFQVLVQPRRSGATGDNVVFDLDGNAVSVNNSMLRACEAGIHAGKSFDCPLGFEPLLGTGYDNCGLGVAGSDAGSCGAFGCDIRAHRRAGSVPSWP
jgi:Putative metal-binding motif